MGRAVLCIVSSSEQVQGILEALVSDGFVHCEISVVYPCIPTDLPSDTVDTDSEGDFGPTERYGPDQNAREFELPGLEPLFAAGPAAVARAVDVTSSDVVAEILEEFGVSNENALIYERVKHGDVLISVRCDGERSLERVREIYIRNGVEAIIEERAATQPWHSRGGLN